MWGLFFLFERRKNMLKKNIKYTDYNGVEREEPHYFNLSKAEIMEMEMSTVGGFAEMIEKIIAAQDTPTLIKIFKDLILKAYGEKSADGKQFMKIDVNGQPLSNKFVQSEAYSVLFMELATDAEAASQFVNGIMPAEFAKKAEQPALIPGK
jgi:hypothetical protein